MRFQKHSFGASGLLVATGGLQFPQDVTFLLVVKVFSGRRSPTQKAWKGSAMCKATTHALQCYEPPKEALKLAERLCRQGHVKLWKV